MSTAAKVRLHKEAHPEMYCAARGCLWRTGGAFGSPCMHHDKAAWGDFQKEQAAAVLRTRTLLKSIAKARGGAA